MGTRRDPREIAADVARSAGSIPGHPDALAARWVLMPPFGGFRAGGEALIECRRQPRIRRFLTERAYFLECVGRSAEAAERSGSARRELDPLNPFAMGLHGQALWFAGHYAEALRGDGIRPHQMARQPSHRRGADPGLCPPPGLGCGRAADRSGAARALSVARTRRGGCLRTGDARPRAARVAAQMFDTIAKRADATGHIDPQVAVIAAELGFVDETFALLERCKFGPSGNPRDVMGTHAYRTLLLFPKAYPALRADPRFVEVCARLGLVEYWLETHTGPIAQRRRPMNSRPSPRGCGIIPKMCFWPERQSRKSLPVRTCPARPASTISMSAILLPLTSACTSRSRPRP